MDSSFREQESGTQQDSKRFFFVNVSIIRSIIEHLASVIKLTEEEQEDAGIYPERLGGE
jgi:hypothetical protein